MATPILPKQTATPDETLVEIRDILDDTKKEGVRKDRKSKKAEKEQLDINQRMAENMSWFSGMYEENNVGKKQKIKDKISEGWTKIFKNRWFEGIFGFMKRMSLADASGFLGLLLGIFILIKTGLLETLIPILIDIATTLINAIIKYLPQFIKFLVHILKDVLPPMFESIFNTILDALGVDKDSPLRKMIKPISKILPWLLAAGVLLAKVLPALTTVFKFLRPLIGGLLKFLPHLGKLLAALNPVGIVALIVAGIWIFAEELSNIYNWIIDKAVGFLTSLFPSLGKYTEGIKSFIKLFLSLTPNIYSLSNLFARIKKDGLIAGIKDALSDFFDLFYDVAGSLVGMFTNYSPEEIKKGVAQAKEITRKFVGEQIDGFISNVKLFFSKEAWGKVADTIKEKFSVVTNTIESANSKISGFFKEQVGGFISNIGLFKEKVTDLPKNMKKGILVYLDKFSLILNKIKKVIKDLVDRGLSFFHTMIEKIQRGLNKLKSAFSKDGIKKTLSNLGSTVVKVIGGAFSEAKNAFKNVFSSIFEVFVSMFDSIDFYLSKLSIFKKSREQEYGAKTAEAYMVEKQYIRAVAEKTGQSEEYLTRIAKGEAQVQAGDSQDLKNFAEAIRMMKSKGEGQQETYLKGILDQLKKGNTSPTITVTNENTDTANKKGSVPQ